MSSLVLDLQKETLNPKTRVADLLRMALVVARKLKLEEFEKWIESEINGYAEAKGVPPYRILTGQPVVVDPVQGPVLMHFSDPESAKRLSTLNINYPVSRIESNFKDADDPNVALIITYTPEFGAYLMREMRCPYQPGVRLEVAQFRGILDAVRNIVLKWTLDLENDNILGEGMTFPPKDKKAAASHTYHIRNYIGHITGSQVQQDTQFSAQTRSNETYDPGDLKRLAQTLKKNLEQIQVSREEKSELQAQIDTIAAQMKSRTPKGSTIRTGLSSIKNILEGAPGGALAEGIVEQIKTILGP